MLLLTTYCVIRLVQVIWQNLIGLADSMTDSTHNGVDWLFLTRHSDSLKHKQNSDSTAWHNWLVFVFVNRTIPLF